MLSPDSQKWQETRNDIMRQPSLVPIFLRNTNRLNEFEYEQDSMETGDWHRHHHPHRHRRDDRHAGLHRADHATDSPFRTLIPFSFNNTTFACMNNDHEFHELNELPCGGIHFQRMERARALLACYRRDARIAMRGVLMRSKFVSFEINSQLKRI